MSLAALRLLPISFNGLVIESTSQCNAKCAMCYQAAGPKGSDVFGKAKLTSDEIRKAVSEAARIPVVKSRCHLAGGEAFLDIAQCIDIFSHARDVGFEDISTTTNAYWANSTARAHEVCRNARQNGLLRMEISWDFWHSPYISGTTIGNCIDACVEHGIQTNLRILSTKAHSVQEALSLIPRDSLSRCDVISCGPVFPTGRAKAEVPKDEIFYTGNLGSTCHSILNLTINPTGKVYPCCAGADQTEALAFGNIRDDSLQTIVERMNRSLLLRVLVFGGPGSFLGILKENGVDLEGPHSNICHMCWDIFSKPEHMAIVSSHIDRMEKNARESLLSSVTDYLRAKELPTA